MFLNQYLLNYSCIHFCQAQAYNLMLLPKMYHLS